nr:hypothetical protein [Tanacetum cinerariifolium]
MALIKFDDGNKEIKGIPKDKIIFYLNKTPDLSQRSLQNCPKCGNSVDGHYCQGSAILRKKFKEDLFTYCVENGILQDSFEPSNDNTNVVNALQEPFVVEQDPGENSPQSPPQINHHCCYRCGNPLEDILCHKCTCELCGRDGNSFTYNSTSNLVRNFPNVFNPPLQPLIYSYEFCGNDACYGHDSSLQVPFTYDPEPGYNQDFNFPQNFQIFQQYPCCTHCGGPHETCQCDQLICDEPYCENYGGPHMNFQCQPMNQNHYEPNPCYDSNSFGFDQFQPPQFPVIHPPIREKTCAELLAEEHEANIDTHFVLAWETILEIELAFEDKHCQPEDILELFQRLHNNVQNIHEELAIYINTPNWDRPTIFYDDDDDEDYVIAVTPSLSTEEPDNSLSMGDEHLDTVSVTESDEFIKSSVESLILIPSESKGIPDNMCDMHFHENSPPLDISKDQSEDFYDSNDESTLIDDDSFSIDNIKYVEASPPDHEVVSLEVMEIVIPEVGRIDDDILLTIKDDIFRLLVAVPLLILIYLLEYEAFYDDHVKEISSGSTTTHSDSSLYDSFIFDLSINPFPPVDKSDFYEFPDELTHIISPPEYDCFCFKNKPKSGGFHYGCGGEYFSNKRTKSS